MISFEPVTWNITSGDVAAILSVNASGWELKWAYPGEAGRLVTGMKAWPAKLCRTEAFRETSKIIRAVESKTHDPDTRDTVPKGVAITDKIVIPLTPIPKHRA